MSDHCVRAYSFILLVLFFYDEKRNHICQKRVCLLVGEQQIKGFHLNVNQRGNKSIMAVVKKDCSLRLPCHMFDSHCQSGRLYRSSFWPRRYQRLKALVTTNYSWMLRDALQTDSFEIHILISISVDGAGLS